MAKSVCSRSTQFLCNLATLALCWKQSEAAFVEFSNCLPQSIVKTQIPNQPLQFVPLNVSAYFDLSDSSHTLNVTVYGNVTGQEFQANYPPPSSPAWSNPNETLGKIQDLEPGATLATTFFNSFNVLSYTPYSAKPAEFCKGPAQQPCPIGPVFYTNSSDIQALRSYTVQRAIYSTYAFTTIAVSSRIESGVNSATYYGCVEAYVTPDLGGSFNTLLRYLPLAILIVVAVATVSAAVWSPWGSNDIFHWSSNSGRDEDIIRLVTPGFGDCLGYIQFAVFTGSLSLNYPGFFQPAMSRVAWSNLMFNESLATDGQGTNPVVDGVYQYRASSTQGLDRLTQLIGMTSPKDAWAGMMVWLMVIIGCAILLAQAGFFIRWLIRKVRDVPNEDFRSKNWYFCVGNVVRIAFGYFLLPIIALSFYQLVIAGSGPVVSVALAAIVLIAIIAFSIWLVFLFIRIRPRSFLYDDLQTLLAYGPLYNTYKEDRAYFALVIIFVNFLRGIAIGAVQSSGVAQIILLAICEIILILTLNVFRPHPYATSMNTYYTCFSSVRLFTILLMIVFAPSLASSASTRGWFGYAILLIHACVLVFGFFLNAIQTLIEVVARLAGAGAQGGSDAARGGLTKVFGMRQLSKRTPRRSAIVRNSMASNAHILAMQEDRKDLQMQRSRSRSRSLSAGSTMLLENGGGRGRRSSRIMESGGTTPDGSSTFSRLSQSMTSGGIVNLEHTTSSDPYYRPPRRNTGDYMSSGRPQVSNTGQKAAADSVEQAVDYSGEGSSTVKQMDYDADDHVGAELTKTKTDYATREVDFYYGVRGPALSSGTRKLKTGPADPTGKSGSMGNFLKNILGGKQKDKHKGFEVVRSAKAPPPARGPAGFPPTPTRISSEPYRDNPMSPLSPTRENGPRPVAPRAKRSYSTRSIRDSTDADPFNTAGEPYMSPIPRTSARPPVLPAMSDIGDIELPSRVGSEASKRQPQRPLIDTSIPIPEVPRKSSRRKSSPHTDQRQIEHLRHISELSPVESQVESTMPISSVAKRETKISTGSNPSVTRLPFADHSINAPTSTAEARKSAVPSEFSEYNAFDTVDSPVENTMPSERPDSVGNVSRYRASDGIRYSPDETGYPSPRIAEYGNASANTMLPWQSPYSGDVLTPQGTPATEKRTSRFRD